MLLRKRFLSLAAVAGLAFAGVACDDGGTDDTTTDPAEDTGATEDPGATEEGTEDTGATEEGAEETEGEG